MIAVVHSRKEQAMKQWMKVCMLAALAVSWVGGFAAESVTVSVNPSVSTVAPGQLFTVNIQVTDAYLLHGSSVIVRFDNTVLALVGAADGDVYTSVQSSPIFWWRPDTSLHADSVVVDQAILGASTYTGSGILFSLTFRALTSGSSPIYLSTLDLRNNNNQAFDVEGIDGLVTVLAVNANIKAYLQGPYSGSAMLTGLNTAGIIPLAQPYSGAPWSYTGTEAVASIPAGVVDWVLVELRTGTAAATKVATRAAFIKSNGAVVDLDGTSAVGFAGVPAGSYYIVLRHRNHLAVMSAAAVALTTTSAVYDFTTGLSKYYGGDAREIATGVFGLWAGDVTANGIVKYSGSSNDRSPILTRIGGSDLTLTVNGYYPEDVNMNGQVKYSGSSNDRSVVLLSVGGSDLTATRSTKVPN